VPYVMSHAYAPRGAPACRAQCRQQPNREAELVVRWAHPCEFAGGTSSRDEYTVRAGSALNRIAAPATSVCFAGRQFRERSEVQLDVRPISCIVVCSPISTFRRSWPVRSRWSAERRSASLTVGEARSGSRSSSHALISSPSFVPLSLVLLLLLACLLLSRSMRSRSLRSLPPSSWRP